MYDVAIIGCGVVGAAAAYELSKYKLSVLVLEAENDAATGTTKANSAIIHAGYDPKPGTLMAALNITGAKLAADICRKLDVPYKQTGSLVLAFTEEDCAVLQTLLERGQKNGVQGLSLLPQKELRKKEPAVSNEAVAALYAPTAAVINPWEYALAMAETAVQNGAVLHLNARVDAVFSHKNGYTLSAGGRSYEAAFVVNAAGIYAAQVHNLALKPAFTITPNRGEYYLLDKPEKPLVSHIIFQCPSKNGKGVLVAPTVHGNVIVGPNAEDTESGSLAVTAAGLQTVAASARKSVPALNLRESIRNFAGLRAYTEQDDFIIAFADVQRRWIDAAGIKSPGLTAAPAIAVKILSLLQEGGLKIKQKTAFVDQRKKIRFAQLPIEEKNCLIRERPEYGRVICRCETITEAEIIDAVHSPIPACSVDGVKRRAGAGMGRCQGGFCSPRVVEILSRELNVSPLEIPQDKRGSVILTGETKNQIEEKTHV